MHSRQEIVLGRMTNSFFHNTLVDTSEIRRIHLTKYLNFTSLVQNYHYRWRKICNIFVMSSKLENKYFLFQMPLRRPFRFTVKSLSVASRNIYISWPLLFWITAVWFFPHNFFVTPSLFFCFFCTPWWTLNWLQLRLRWEFNTPGISRGCLH